MKTEPSRVNELNGPGKESLETEASRVSWGGIPGRSMLHRKQTPEISGGVLGVFSRGQIGAACKETTI